MRYRGLPTMRACLADRDSNPLPDVMTRSRTSWWTSKGGQEIHKIRTAERQGVSRGWTRICWPGMRTRRRARSMVAFVATLVLSLSDVYVAAGAPHYGP